MVSNSIFNIVIFNHDHDFTNNAPSSGDALNRFDVDGRTGGTPLVLNYTLATGYANNVNGVAAASIGNVIGVATANIDKINGV